MRYERSKKFLTFFSPSFFPQINISVSSLKGFLRYFTLTLSTPALQSYVIHHTCMRQKFHFSKMLFLPWLTIVLHRITKKNLHFSPKEARVHYNLSSIVCYSLFLSVSAFICPKNTNWWRIRSNFVLFFLL